MSGKHEMLRANLGNIRESLGDFDRSAPTSAVGPRPTSAKMVGVTRSRDVSEIDVDRIVPDPDQPRKEFEAEALSRLAESLRTRGQLQPIQVRWDEGFGRYVILMGERRWRAAQMGGVAKLQCVVREAPLTEDERLSIQLIENALREDLSPMDQARAFRTLMDRRGWSQEQLAEELSVSRTLVGRSLSLLKLPSAVQAEVEQGGLGPSAAYEIAKLDDPAAQIRLATAAAEQGLTREDVAKQVRRTPAKKKAASKLPTTVVLKVGGCRIEVSRKAGLDDATLFAAFAEAMEKYRPSAASDAA